MQQTSPLISIIVPVYNAEQYLDKCVDSIVNQTYTNLEIILIDDGSPDNCGAICDEWAKKDSRIKVIHKPNGGVSSARNKALQIINGEYVAFVDSDDFIHQDYIGILYNALLNGADLSVCAMNKFYDIPKNLDIKPTFNERETLSRSQTFSALLNEQKIYGYLWNKLFKRSLIKNSFREDIHFGEDFLFCAQYVEGINQASFCDFALYNYRQDSLGSITKNRFAYTYKHFSLLLAQEEIIKIYSKNAKHEIKNFQKIMLDTALNLLARYKYNKSKNKEQYIVIKSIINEYYRGVVSSLGIMQRFRYCLKKKIPLAYFKHQYRKAL